MSFRDHPSEPADTDRRSSALGLAILAGLQGKHVYQGTVSTADRARRRAANRRARASRKANR